jgi:ribosomal small subunit protein bTHX
MGKGDRRTKRGKVNKSSYGNSRPKPSKGRSVPKKKEETAGKEEKED